MAVERFLVVLEEGTSLQSAQGVIAALGQIGKVEYVIGQGRTVIAAFDGAYAESVRGLPRVQLVGGIRVGKRTVATKQVRTR